MASSHPYALKQPWFDAADFFEGVVTILTQGVQAYYESQLASLPEKDGTWPQTVCDPGLVDPDNLPLLIGEPVPIFLAEYV